MGKMRHETVVGIIGLFRKEPGASYAISEIAEGTKIAYCSAHSHIGELAKLGVLKTQMRGRSKLCSLNPRSNRARLLLALSATNPTEAFLAKKPALRPVLEALMEKAEGELKNELHSAVLFGSYVKGEERRESDIDLLFIASDLKTARKIEALCNGISAAYGKKLAPIVSDVEQFEKMLKAKEQTIGKEAVADGVILFGHEKFYGTVLSVLGGRNGT
jgi:predicted nucleotidyltransferase